MADEAQPKTEAIEIVPPFMSDLWRRFRVHMGAVHGYAELAQEQSTTELARTYLGSASAALMDADFVLRQIEKGAVDGGGDQEPVDHDRG